SHFSLLLSSEREVAVCVRGNLVGRIFCNRECVAGEETLIPHWFEVRSVCVGLIYPAAPSEDHICLTGLSHLSLLRAGFPIFDIGLDRVPFLKRSFQIKRIEVVFLNSICKERSFKRACSCRLPTFYTSSAWKLFSIKEVFPPGWRLVSIFVCIVEEAVNINLGRQVAVTLRRCFRDFARVDKREIEFLIESSAICGIFRGTCIDYIPGDVTGVHLCFKFSVIRRTI